MLIQDTTTTQLIAQFSGNLYEDLLNDAGFAQSLFDEAVNGLWQRYILDNSPLWLQITRIGTMIALIGFAIRFFEMIGKFNSDEPFKFDGAFFAIIIAVALANQSALIGNISLGFFGLQDAINQNVIVELREALEVEQTFNRTLGNRVARGMYRIAHSNCSGEFLNNIPEYEECMTEELARAEEAIAAQAEQRGWFARITTHLGELRAGLRENAASTLKYITASTLGLEQRIRLLTYGAVFNVTGNLVLFLFGLFSPIIIGATTMPGGEQGLFAYLSGFYAVGVSKLSYTFIVLLAGNIFSTADNLGEDILAIMIGFGAPLLAVGVAFGTTRMVYESVSSIGTRAASSFSLGSLLSRKF